MLARYTQACIRDTACRSYTVDERREIRIVAPSTPYVITNVITESASIVRLTDILPPSGRQLVNRKFDSLGFPSQLSPPHILMDQILFSRLSVLPQAYLILVVHFLSLRSLSKVSECEPISLRFDAK